jgi:hypothetical protein
MTATDERQAFSSMQDVHFLSPKYKPIYNLHFYAENYFDLQTFVEHLNRIILLLERFLPFVCKLKLMYNYITTKK